jgi:hypothetical protein
MLLVWVRNAKLVSIGQCRSGTHILYHAYHVSGIGRANPDKRSVPVSGLHALVRHVKADWNDKLDLHGAYPVGLRWFVHRFVGSQFAV